jgi:hypothetical protein
MSKPAIVMLSIFASLLAIASIADARSTIDRISIHQPLDRSRVNLIAKQSNSISNSSNRKISGSDLNGIHQTIAQSYLTKNQNLEKATGNDRRFYEVKRMKLISFSGKKARIEIEEDIRNYKLTSHRPSSFEDRSFKKAPGTEYIKHIFKIDLEKSGGKWTIKTKLK